MRQPGRGHGLQVVVGQREDREAVDQSQGFIMITDQSELSSPGQAGERGGAEADDGVVAEVEHRQGRQAWNENCQALVPSLKSSPNRPRPKPKAVPNQI